MFGQVKIIVIGIIVLVVVGCLWYVSNLQANLAIAKENQVKLEKAIESQKEAMASMQADIKQQQSIANDLRLKEAVAAKDVKDLQEKLKKDLGKIATTKPASIERAINRGSINALRCIELASGAPFNERERNAKTPKEVNPECPNIVAALIKP